MPRRPAALLPLTAVAAAAEAAFEEESGGIEFPVICPDDLEAEVGAQTYCVLRNTTRNERTSTCA